MIEYAHQLEEQNDIYEPGIEVADSPPPPVDPKTTAITYSRGDDLGDTTIWSMTSNIRKRYYDMHHHAASMHTPEILHTG